MTLYFDTKVEFLDPSAVSTIGSWHIGEPYFAVASVSQELGGSITVFTDTGEPQRDVTYPVHANSQVSSLAWHPEKVLLITGWESGDLYVWFYELREFANVHGPHKSPIVLTEFSEQGGRLVTADSLGLLTGWRYDGQYQFLTMFSHDLRDHLLHITFRRTIESQVREEIVHLAKAAVAGDENALDTLTNWRPRTAVRSLTHAGVKDNHCFYVGTRTGLVYYINQGGTCNEVLKSNTLSIINMIWHPKKDAVICLLEDLTVALYLAEATGILTELDRVKLSGKLNAKYGSICWAGNCLAIISGDMTVRIWDIEKSDNYLLKMTLQNYDKKRDNFTSLECTLSSNTFLSQSQSQSQSTDSPTPTGHNLYENNRKQHNNALQQQTAHENFTCLSYCHSNQTLSACTNQGNVYTWKRLHATFYNNLPEESWQLTNVSNVRGGIKECTWGFNEMAQPCMLINCVANVYMLKEQPLLSCHTRELWLVQRNAKTVNLEQPNGKKLKIQTDFAITAMAINRTNIILSNGRSIATYNIERPIENVNILNDGVTGGSGGGGGGNGGGGINNSIVTNSTSNSATGLSVNLMQIFQADCLTLNIYNQNIFCLTTSDIVIYSIGGVVLNKIMSNDHEGKIIGMDLTNCYLTIFTMNGFLKAYDVSRHDPKMLFPSKSGYDLFEDFGEFIIAKCNCVGTHLATVIANKSFLPISTLYCWDFERNNLMAYNLGKKNDKNPFCMPVSVFWDTDEERLLAIEIKSVNSPGQFEQNKFRSSVNNEKSIQSSNQQVESQILIMFYTEKLKLHVLETRLLANGEQLINLCVPNVLTLELNALIEKPLQDFIDLMDCDISTRKLVLNFSLHVAEGNMDAAYRCIRSIQSKTIWTNLAKMCVLTSRLDVAKVCMGHLEKARSVRAVRQALENDDLEQEAKIAVLATELGMYDKAQELYKNCERYDLLNKLMQSSGKINDAIKIAEKEDRVNLKNTYYQKAVQLREAGDVKNALEFYEKSQNPVQNITQMLLETPTTMKRYMQTTTDKKMLNWWGKYVESSGDMDGALAIYQKAEDWYSQVKILCYLGKISKADAIARQSGDRAACYHLARHYENVGKYQEAILFYTRAQTFSNAIRICKENDFQDELWTVAGSSNNRDKANAAVYFEECGAFKRAVELYHRAGMLHKALEMAFELKQPDILEVIATELTVESDAELINRCADFFTEIEQHQKAVQLLAKTKHLERALQICTDKGVPITEELAEALTPNKNELNEEIRAKLLAQLGELLQQQGDYHAATKKFTQAGDKVRAMKSLLKSGNTDKIIFFANMSRQREVYIMAANYLQALNWQDNANILKHIVTFYSKGQAYDSLANFYAICAQIEIDDYHDYEKALKAMYEAAKCLEKLNHTQNAYNNLQRTIADVKNILDVQNHFKNNNYDAAINGCRNILLKPEMPPIRHADIYALLIRALTYTKQYNEAARVLKELAMKNSSWSSSGLLEKALVQKIAKECNLDFDIIWNSGRKEVTTTSDDEQDRDDEIQEELH